MAPHDVHDPTGDPANTRDAGVHWVRLCDDFVNLEGQCALLCDLLVSLGQREMPLEAASKHGIERFTSQVKQQLTQVKQQLYQLRPD